MHGARIAVGTMLLLAGAAAPAAALPDAAKNAKPRFVSAEATAGPESSGRVVVVGRDRDDVVRGVEVSWGEAGSGQGISACELSSRSRGADERRRGRKARFELSHAYSAPGHYTITLTLLSGGCGKRPQQRSTPRTLTVHVE
jgi:hypothetical protein